MNANLYTQFRLSYQVVQDILMDFPVNHNPFEMRIAPLLAEQQIMLWNALVLLQQQPLDMKKLKYIISVIYRNNESFDPIYRGWIRASKWTESARPEILMQKMRLSDLLRQHLIHGVPYIQAIYGKEETRYIIPPLFRYESKLRNESRGN
jgi:hypothetical protein